LLAFLAGYGTATGLNLWLGSLIPPESSPSSKHYGQRRN
jgi:hypothetical protein